MIVTAVKFGACVYQGIVVAGPVYAATGNRWKAVGLAFASVCTALRSS